MNNEEECEACKALRRGLTWIGVPPRCSKHQKRITPDMWRQLPLGVGK